MQSRIFLLPPRYVTRRSSRAGVTFMKTGRLGESERKAGRFQPRHGSKLRSRIARTDPVRSGAKTSIIIRPFDFSTHPYAPGSSLESAEHLLGIFFKDFFFVGRSQPRD